MGNPLWWVGTLAAVVAYCLQIIALGFGTLLVVQHILVLSLMFTLPLGRGGGAHGHLGYGTRRGGSPDELPW